MPATPFLPVTHVFLGSIGAIAETSDIQRQAYNAALAEAGVGWSWDPATYAGLLGMVGGKERLALLSGATNAGLTQETIERIHRRKTEIACARIRAEKTPLRPGVAHLVALALERRLTLALVTTTARVNIDAIADAAGSDLPLERFKTVVTRSDVTRGKPAPDCYHVALERTGAGPRGCIALEDTASGVAAARRAGIRTIATPGALSKGQDVDDADLVLESLLDAEGRLEHSIFTLMFG
ncbi:MAG: HAD family hydrolase [Alphaproteobacteria bacterium]